MSIKKRLLFFRGHLRKDLAIFLLFMRPLILMLYWIDVMVCRIWKFLSLGKIQMRQWHNLLQIKHPDQMGLMVHSSRPVGTSFLWIFISLYMIYFKVMSLHYKNKHQTLGQHTLEKIILKFVHMNQYGFLKTRSLQDCLLWAFEYVHLRRQPKQEIIILKLDFEETSDLIEHQLILNILEAR